MSENESASSSNEAHLISEAVEKKDEIVEPETKKMKLSAPSGKSDKLEQRLGGILCCAVCLDLPISAVYQVNGTHFHV